MINKKLLMSVKESLPYIKKNVLFQWLSMLCSIAISALLAAAMASLFFHQFYWCLYGTTFGILVLLALRYFFIQQASKASYTSSALVKKTMRERLYKKLCEIGPGYMAAFSTAEVVQLSSEGVEQLETYFASYIPQFFYALLAPLTLFVVCLFLDWKAALALFVCVPLIPMAIIAVQKFAKKLLNRYWGQYTQLSDSFLENLQGLTTLKIYQADERAHEKMNEQSENFRKITMRVLIMQLNSISVMDFVAYGGAALGIGIAITSLAHQNITPFAAILIVLLSAEFFIPMRQLGSFFHISMNGAAAADKMFKILEYPVDINRTEVIESRNPSIKAKHLSFSYSKEKEALKDISFDIPSSGMVAFVGKSGSGKSTIASLLSAKLSNYEGDLEIGKIPYKKAKTSSILDKVCLLTHESYLFEGSIRSNLLMANEKATEEEMWDVLEKARIADFLKELKGLDTVVEQNGSNFSGGQRQRIAFARMLLYDAPIMILDEATSNIDSASENAIMRCVSNMKNEKSIICISHRLANVINANNIYVLQDGKIVQEGDHKKLLGEKGLYQDLWNGQKVYEEYAKEDEDEKE